MLSTSFATGINPKILSDRVGHSNPTITFQVYTHRSTGQDRAAAQLIGQLIETPLTGSQNTQPTTRDEALTTIFTTTT